MGIYQDPSAQKDSSGIAGLSTSTPSPFLSKWPLKFPQRRFKVTSSGWRQLSRMDCKGPTTRLEWLRLSNKAPSLPGTLR